MNDQVKSLDRRARGGSSSGQRRYSGKHRKLRDPDGGAMCESQPETEVVDPLTLAMGMTPNWGPGVATPVSFWDTAGAAGLALWATAMWVAVGLLARANRRPVRPWMFRTSVAVIV